MIQCYKKQRNTSIFFIEALKTYVNYSKIIEIEKGDKCEKENERKKCTKKVV